MVKSPNRLDQERPSGPVVWHPPKRKRLGARELLPAAFFLLGPVLAWFVFAYLLS